MRGNDTKFYSARYTLYGRAFLARFRRSGHDRKLERSNEISSYKIKIRERAADTLAESEELRQCRSFSDFKGLFLQHFQAEEPVIVCMNNFISCRQLPQQDVRQYVTSLKGAAAKYYGTATQGSTGTYDKFRDETLMCRFLEGLKREIREVVTRRYPVTFSEAIGMAIREEQSAKFLLRHTQYGKHCRRQQQG